MANLRKANPKLWPALVPPSAAGFALISLLAGSNMLKAGTILGILLVFFAAVLYFSKLRSRITPPMLVLTLVVAVDGISMIYAASRKFAFYEFMKALSAFCLVLLLLAAAPGEKRRSGDWIASILAFASALIGVFSIDFISTRVFSAPLLDFLSGHDPSYGTLGGVEAGVRMTSILPNPNVFAGIVGLGALLSLGLARSSRSRKVRCAYLALLYVNALSFVLVFSMGASAMLVMALLAFLLLEPRERRMDLLILMLTTLILAVLSAALISAVSFQAWDGIQPVPLLCLALGAAALCALDFFAGGKAAEWLSRRRHGSLLFASGVISAVFFFVLLAGNLTGPATLQAGEVLRRAARPEPGSYVLSVQADTPVYVTIENQDLQGAMTHTSAILYEGPADGAGFTVPEDSIVVYFNLFSEQEVRLEEVRWQDPLPLNYILLPGFVANRLQGLWANQNAIQRLVFFQDGLALARQSPLLGRGLGGFENGLKSIQSFYYETQYVHNHYIQSWLDTGVLGLGLFVGLIAISGASVLLARRKENHHSLLPALGAALVFMAGHGAVELVFSYYAYLPFAFGVFALIGLCAEGVFPAGRKWGMVQTSVLLCALGLMAVFGIFLGFNIRAAALPATMEHYKTAVKIDKFEWADYALSYVLNAVDSEDGSEIRLQADDYARRLSDLDSNAVPLYLAEYYFATGRVEQGLEMAKKHAAYSASDPAAWQSVFDLLERYEEDTTLYRSGVLQISDMLNQWNAENLGQIQLNGETEAFIARISGS